MRKLRSEIKHNFLKQIIFRLDYEGLMESDIEECIVSLRQMFYNNGFEKMDNRTENQFDVQIKTDLNIPDENRFSINSNSKSIVYRFSSEKKEIIEINKSFFALTVDIEQKYETFDKYLSLLAESIEKIKSVSPYFHILRIGLRKINVCLFDNLRELSNYFTKAAFNMDDVMEQFKNCNCTASNMVTVLSKNDYQINYIRNIQEGIMQQDDGSQKTMYQIIVDIDVFKEGNREILPLLCDNQMIKDTLETQNTIEFYVFINSLSKELIEKLKQDAFQDTVIKGVV